MNEREVYRRLAEDMAADRPVALCTVVFTRGSVPRRPGSKMLVYEDGSFFGTVGGGQLEARVLVAAREALQDGRPRYLSYNMVDPERGDPGVCGGEVHVYVEPILPPPTLLVIGAGHVGRAVVRMGKLLGWRVVLADPREAWCNPEVLPDADAYIVAPPAEMPARLPLTRHTYAVLVTPGTDWDVELLPALLQSPIAYIGIIGSRRRWQTTRRRLMEEKGIPEEALARVVSPIGLEIGAETPEEIAVSILAQVIGIYRGVFTSTGEPIADRRRTTEALRVPSLLSESPEHAGPASSASPK